MPKIARSGQDWILDRFIGTLGVNALMPGFMTFMASPIVGFSNADLERIADRTQGLSSMRRAYMRAGDYRASSMVISDALSAIMMVGALVLPDIRSGITEASTTRRPSMPRTRKRASPFILVIIISAQRTPSDA